MRLLECPTAFDCAYQRDARCIRRVIGKVIFALGAAARFVHQPCGLARKMLPMRNQCTVCPAQGTEAKGALSMPLVTQRQEERCMALIPSIAIIRMTDKLDT